MFKAFNAPWWLWLLGSFLYQRIYLRPTYYNLYNNLSCYAIIKNLNSSTSHKKICFYVFPLLRDISFFLSSTFIYNPILMNIYMNANIMKMYSEVIEGYIRFYI